MGAEIVSRDHSRNWTMRLSGITASGKLSLSFIEQTEMVSGTGEIAGLAFSGRAASRILLGAISTGSGQAGLANEGWAAGSGASTASWWLLYQR